VVFQFGYNIFFQVQIVAPFFGRRYSGRAVFFPIVPNVVVTSTLTNFGDGLPWADIVRRGKLNQGEMVCKGGAMTRLTNDSMYDDIYEYFGGTTIQRTRIKADETVWRDWLLFDSIEAAFEFFNESGSAG
jgi:hypothetical protein